MILPIVAYGDVVLRKKATDITSNYPELSTLIANMYETMYNAYGVGLAAPQIGLSIRLFVIDTTSFAEDDNLSEQERTFLNGLKRTFINPQIIEEEGALWSFNEGCLSIPDVREDVSRQPNITITYLDENFNEHTESFSGIAARVIQHEYDHIEGILFTDKLSSFKKRLIKSKLNNISKGNIDIDYKMKFPLQTKKR